uniref:PPUP9740 n=1 Tax=Poeciliopsis prolifica TaxID=188132 RepID=A0A0S7EPS7_9TELE
MSYVLEEERETLGWRRRANASQVCGTIGPTQRDEGICVKNREDALVGLWSMGGRIMSKEVGKVSWDQIVKVFTMDFLYDQEAKMKPLRSMKSESKIIRIASKENHLTSRVEVD